jgi:hypothetical protein
MPDTPVDHWNKKTFEGQDDIQLIGLLSAVIEAGTDESDRNFAQAIRNELIQRARVREGKKRTWGEAP